MCGASPLPLLSLGSLLLQLIHRAAAVAADSAPCDIYAAGGTPCVAAHSLSRALYSHYAGPLYRLQRDGSTRAATDIGVLGPGGRADSAAHDAFCSAPGAACIVERIYDQSPWGNHLGVEHGPPYLKGPRGAQDRPVNFTDSRSAATLGGQKIYAAYFAGGDQRTYGQGYSNRTARGTAVGEEPQSIYAVLSGKTFNGHCCFD
eukprot:COSAG02_NODE_2563_length_8525_cov_90.068835_9_plen_203_part_00